MRFVFNRDPIPQAGAPAVPYPSLALRSKALQPKRISHFQTDSVGFPAGRPKYSTSRTSQLDVKPPHKSPIWASLHIQTDTLPCRGGLGGPCCGHRTPKSRPENACFQNSWFQGRERGGFL